MFVTNISNPRSSANVFLINSLFEFTKIDYFYYLLVCLDINRLFLLSACMDARAHTCMYVHAHAHANRPRTSRLMSMQCPQDASFFTLHKMRY